METTLPRPEALEQSRPASTDEMATKIKEVIRNAKGRELIDSTSFEVLISQLDAEDLAALAPLVFNKRVAAILLGDGYEQVLKQPFAHVTEQVAATIDPDLRQTVVA